MTFTNGQCFLEFKNIYILSTVNTSAVDMLLKVGFHIRIVGIPTDDFVIKY